jgi:hypothetical protein
MKAKPVTKAQENRARAIVQRAMDQQREREVAEKRALIGQCFKYWNGYSGDEKWWLYAVVTGVDERGRLSAIQFQHNSLDGISLEADAYPGLLPQGGWTRIAQIEFRDAAVHIANAFLERVLRATKAAGGGSAATGDGASH